MDGGKVAVCICKGWVDLYGPRVALHGSRNVLHLLQSVTHVAVRICKVWVDAVDVCYVCAHVWVCGVLCVREDMKCECEEMCEGVCGCVGGYVSG